LWQNHGNVIKLCSKTRIRSPCFHIRYAFPLIPLLFTIPLTLFSISLPLIKTRSYAILLIEKKSSLDRSQRIKDARTEAAKEIETLKAQKNKEFAAFEQKVCVINLKSKQLS
jgi:hypothetical protein